MTAKASDWLQRHMSHEHEVIGKVPRGTVELWWCWNGGDGKGILQLIFYFSAAGGGGWNPINFAKCLRQLPHVITGLGMAQLSR